VWALVCVGRDRGLLAKPVDAVAAPACCPACCHCCLNYAAMGRQVICKCQQSNSAPQGAGLAGPAGGSHGCPAPGSTPSRGDCAAFQVERVSAAAAAAAAELCCVLVCPLRAAQTLLSMITPQGGRLPSVGLTCRSTHRQIRTFGINQGLCTHCLWPLLLPFISW